MVKVRYLDRTIVKEEKLPRIRQLNLFDDMVGQENAEYFKVVKEVETVLQCYDEVEKKWVDVPTVQETVKE